MGRKTKLTPQVQSTICKLIKSGNYIKTACHAVGIREATYLNWLSWGEQQGKGLYFEFFVAVKRAEAQAITRNVAIIQKASHDTWQAAAWWLERKFPQEWGKKERHELTGEGGQPLVPRSMQLVLADGTEIKPPRNGHRPQEVNVGDNGHGG